MNWADGPHRDSILSTKLNFSVVFKNSEGQEIAGVLFIDGAWKISTDPLTRFATIGETLDAWETRFNHETGMLLPYPRVIKLKDKEAGSGG